jgi:hypothetical protein
MINPIFSLRYDIIVGFTGESTLPDLVVHELINIIKNFTVNQQRDFWAVIVKSLKSANDLLHHSTITVIFRENGTVVCRELGLHDPPSRVMGVNFFCGGLECRPLPGELRYKNDSGPDFRKETVRQDCKKCQFRSRNVKIQEVDWVHRLPGNPRIFWHDYPPAPQQRALFADAKGPRIVQDTKAKRERADTVNTVEGPSKKRM